MPSGNRDNSSFGYSPASIIRANWPVLSTSVASMRRLSKAKCPIRSANRMASVYGSCPIAAPASQMRGQLRPASLGRLCSTTRSSTCWSRKKKVKAKLRPSLNPPALPVSSRALGHSTHSKIHGLLRVQDQEQPVFQLVDAADEIPSRGIEVLRRPLKGGRVHVEHVADLVDQQTDGAVLGADHHVHRRLVPGADE